jgi:hypothetical protein
MARPFGGLPDRFEPVGEPVGLGVLLPGRAYSPAGPLLEFARQSLLAHGWSVRAVWWDAPDLPTEQETVAWACGELAAAVGDATGPVTVVGKSLGTLAAPLAAERGWDAVWFTPLMGLRALAEAIAAHPGRQLLVGGTADSLWDPAMARRLRGERCRVVEVAGADHAMWVPGDAVRSAEIQLEVTRAVDAFVAG